MEQAIPQLTPRERELVALGSNCTTGPDCMSTSGSNFWPGVWSPLHGAAVEPLAVA